VPQFVTDDGVRIVYQMWNRPTVLPPLVLHHGFTGGATCDWVESGVVAALTAALLHSVRSRRAEASTAVQNQITRASSSNATVSRRIAGSSTASS
jgi:pimeloyl-ACP methyl ester carboxylesterase